MKKNIKANIKHLILKLTGRVRHLKIGVKCKHEWYGNEYGGFYIYPKLLNKNSIIYSFGIGEDISFDKALIEKYNCNVYAFDPTPKSLNWIKSQKLPENFMFYDFGISSKSGLIDFHLPINKKDVSGSIIVHDKINLNRKVKVKMKTLNDIINELEHKHIDVLKMDIEGAEYDVIINILNTKISVTQFLIEFHERFFEKGKDKTKEAIKKLNSNGYEIFAISNTFREISFIEKKAL